MDRVVAFILDHLLALKQHRLNHAVIDPVLGQLAVTAVDHIKPAIAQQANAQRATLQAVRHGDFSGRVERRVIHQPITQGQQLHGAFH